ncbi:hypothetical protein DDZ13_01965 [Coraliomargarita sinensis]|uniref:Uncharacterized protein n=1 Tax=Coraliomargarita sinensis TaxID=2174842 RepID=A0A317ZN48_9BACT|nr:hypothetical protein [Coraliomargarita sinensis]PXA05663.1 hypothetical protein DDZ13_01965 [Coraliomargarita sinensis]
MKPKIFLLGLFVWLASVGTAYYLGLKFNAWEPDGAEQAEVTSVEAQAVKDAASIEEREAPSKSIGSILEMSQEDLNEALRQASELNESDQRALLAEAFALPNSDFRRARMIRSLLSDLAETSPTEALALAEEIGSLRETERAREAILEIWAQKDPVAALSWANFNLANEPLRTQSSQLIAIYRGYAQTNPKAAFASALDMPTENRGQERIQNYALEEIIEQQIENGGLLEAKLQVELMEDGAIKDSLISELVDEWASFDPEGAAAYVDSLGDKVHGSVKARLLGEWAENDPAAAAAWLSSREVDERTLGHASTAIIRQWTRYDMAASAEWLNSQPSSPELDRAVMSYTYRAAQEDPANAMTWAESISNDRMRDRMMQHVAGNWKSDDPEGFQSYIDSAELSEEQKKELQEGAAVHGGRRWWR